MTYFEFIEAQCAVRRGDKWRGFAELNGRPRNVRRCTQREKVYVQVTQLWLLAG